MVTTRPLAVDPNTGALKEVDGINDKVPVDVVPVMGAATSTVDGTAGIVPKPLIADADKFLKGNGTWDAELKDSVLRIVSATNTTKKISIDASNVPENVTISITAPNSNYVLCKQKLTATSAPSASNGDYQGWVVGSTWFDVSADKGYVCIDSTDGNAVWKRLDSDPITSDVFTGDGNETAFTLSKTPQNLQAINVFVGGVYQHSSAITSLVGAVLTFSGVPPNGAPIDVIHLS